MADYLSVASVTLTDAQIKALPTVSVELVPAAGDDRLIVPVSCVCRLTTTAKYETLTDGSLVLMYPSGGYASTVLPIQSFFNVVGQTMTVILACPKMLVGSGSFASEVRSDEQLVVSSSGLNEPIVLADNYNGTETNYTGGHASNTLKVSVLYVVYDVETGAYVSPGATAVPAGVPYATYIAGGVRGGR